MMSWGLIQNSIRLSSVYELKKQLIITKIGNNVLDSILITSSGSGAQFMMDTNASSLIKLASYVL